MVRLSLVNLYLHGFTEPHIEEYDTLTSEEKWNELADVILANPPFMSPKGGIKPHKRFTVQAKRSEVLFMDYIAEHLTPNGRAAVIVPEGIIFQSGMAYKQLRKMLVEQSLVAVVSLPAGVFQPYSGVKTSILILNKRLAKKRDDILFVKIENDGFGLGAQRRPVDGEQLTETAELLKKFFGGTMSSSSADSGDAVPPQFAHAVPKKQIAENGEFNLSGERYKTVEAHSSDYPMVRVGDVCRINPDTLVPKEHYPDSYFNYIDISCVENESGKFLGAIKTDVNEAPSRARRAISPDDVIISTVRPNLKAFAIISIVPERSVASTGFAVLRAINERILPGFLITVLRHECSVNQMVGMSGKGAYPSINKSDVASIQIPLPPLEVQKEIVAEIEGYQKVIDGARAVLENYRPHIPIHPDWPMVELSEVCESITDGDHQAPPKSDSGIPFVTISNMTAENRLDFSKTFFVPKEYFFNLKDNRKPKQGDILYSVTGSYGLPVLVDFDKEFCFQRHIGLIRTAAKLDERFLFALLLTPFMKKQADDSATGVAQKTVSLRAIRKFKVPLPSLKEQQAIVAEIEAEQALVAANRELIARFEEKTRQTIARVWGDA